MDGGHNGSVEDLLEELTCHRVMLTSLEDEPHDGVEEERKEIQESIARLERAVEEARQGASRTETILPDAVEHDAPFPPRRPAGDNVFYFQRTPADGISASSPGPSRAAMTTPSRRGVRNDMVTFSLPSRKRERAATSLRRQEEQNKSRRTAPVPTSSHPFSSPTGPSNPHVELIDLTGDDEYEPPTPSRPRPGIPAQSTRRTQLNPSTGGNAFDRIMSTQRLNSGPSAHVSDDNDLYSELPMGRYLPTNEGHTAGTYSNGWITPGPSGSGDYLPSGPPQSNNNGVRQPLTHQSPNSGMASAHTPSARNSPGLRGSAVSGSRISPSMMGPPYPFANFPFHPGEDSAFTFGTPGSLSGYTNAFPSDAPLWQSARTPSTSRPSPGRRAGPPPGGGISPPPNEYASPIGNMGWLSGIGNAPVLPSNGTPARGGDLSSIIQRTGRFDFVNGTDEFGNPLGERLTNYIHDVMHDSRLSDKELDDLLSNIRPDMDIPETNHDGTPGGLKGTLYRHQELALSWSKNMEQGPNKGGILADDMGLGKTISMISLMLTRKATARPKTNLIIAPVALLRQWEEEIRTKVKPGHRLSTMIYHQKKATTDELLKYDVVLTTYGTLAAELKKLEELRHEDFERRVDYNDKAVAIKCPLLHPTKAMFHRIILDEAQCIKNSKTRTAKAACQLRSTYRWCLTGTPMMNSVTELFSLIAFLRIRPYNQWDTFRSAFGPLFNKRGSRSTALNKLRALLKATMLRRKKDSELDGKPIIRLPPKTQEDVQVQLDTDERDFYNQLEHKSQVIFNKYVRDGTVGKNYSNILVLLLKLRQACCHPHLDLDFEEAAAPIDEWDEGILSLVKNLEPSVVDRIKEMDGAFECPICTDAVPSPSFFIPCGHDTCSECLTRLVDSESTSLIQQGNEGGSPGNVRCPVCRSNFDPRKCFTFELFRKIHMPETVNKEEAVQADDDDDSDTDSESGSELDSGSDTGSEEVDHRGNLRDFIVDDDYFSSGAEDEEAESKNDVKREGSTPIQAPKVEKKKKRKSKKSKKKHKGEGKDKAHDVKPGMLKSLRKEARKNRAAHKKYMAYLRKTWLPSTKVTECMKLLNRIQETTGEKTIIFSQWTMLLDLLEVAMRNEGFARKHERYDGSMSAVQRNDAASAFRSNPDVKVILVSLRAGNAGLNLTAASHVIIMDPFWNPYVEMQAVDRAYRIGQQREVKVYRILTQETVEDRIIQLQEDKKEIIEAALDESESRKIGRLGIAELKYLFTGRR